MTTIHPDQCAFPTRESGDPGLTVRAEFARAAMQGYCSNPDVNHRTPEVVAARAVQQADALIAALNQPNP